MMDTSCFEGTTESQANPKLLKMQRSTSRDIIIMLPFEPRAPIHRQLSTDISDAATINDTAAVDTEKIMDTQMVEAEVLIAADFSLYDSPLRYLRKPATRQETAHTYLNVTDMVAADLTSYGNPLNNILSPACHSKINLSPSLQDFNRPWVHAEFELRKAASDTVCYKK